MIKSNSNLERELLDLCSLVLFSFDLEISLYMSNGVTFKILKKFTNN